MERREFLAAGLALPGALTGIVTEPGRSRPAQHVDAPFDQVVGLVEQLMREHGIPGAAFGVIKDGQLQMRALGITSVEDPRPVTPDTVFELASLSKTLTATAAMRLVEQGRLDLDAPVRRVVPTFRVEDEDASRSVTLRHLLTHTPGWEARYSVEDLGREALARWVGATEDMIQIAPPGRVWSYNNPGFALAGHLIELASGMEVRDAFQELVFSPIGLDRASTRLTDIVTWPVAVGHRPGRGGAAQVVRPYSMGSSIPAGGVNMSLASLMKYAAFHLGEHDGVGEGALSRRTREAMWAPQLAKEPTTEAMGIGWHLRTVGGVLTAAHGGTAGAGHRCHLQIVPARRLGFAILSNHTEGWRLLQAVERATLEAFEGLALAPNQAICGYRGHTETLDHVTPLVAQPHPDEYTGRYLSSRANVVEVRSGPEGDLRVGEDDEASSVLFYGRDAAVARRGPDTGVNHDFIREAGEVRWMRIGGRIARKVE